MQVLLGCAALLLAVGFLLYSLECCVLLDPWWQALQWPCLAAALAGVAGVAWWRRRRPSERAGWLVFLGGALVGPLAVLATFGTVNCWLDFAPPEWREATVVSRRSKNLSHQVPIRIGELSLHLDGVNFQYPCGPSRLDTYGQTVQVRVNRGLLGYRWAGAVR
jgi:MYXO-CTERM domain-containing protein